MDFHTHFMLLQAAIESLKNYRSPESNKRIFPFQAAPHLIVSFPQKVFFIVLILVLLLECRETIYYANMRVIRKTIVGTLSGFRVIWDSRRKKFPRMGK